MIEQAYPMHVPLVLGDNPLADRICFYLTNWGKQRGESVALVRLREGGADLDEVMKSTFMLYAQEDVGRVTVIINAHELEARRCETSPDDAFAENAMSAAHAALAARAAGVPLLQVSTGQVYGSPRPGLNNIEKLPVPNTIYGLTMYEAEQAVRSIHPGGRDDGRGGIGACVVRIGELYGFDLPACWPVRANKVERPSSPLLVPNDRKVSPSFIGEVAFLIARNVLESPNLLRRPLVHCSPGRSGESWFAFLQLRVTGGGIRPVSTKFVDAQTDASLQATQGWFLPNDPAKSWRDFTEEQGSRQYLRYWNET